MITPNREGTRPLQSVVQGPSQKREECEQAEVNQESRRRWPDFAAELEEETGIDEGPSPRAA